MFILLIIPLLFLTGMLFFSRFISSHSLYYFLSHVFQLLFLPFILCSSFFFLFLDCFFLSFLILCSSFIFNSSMLKSLYIQSAISLLSSSRSSLCIFGQWPSLTFTLSICSLFTWLRAISIIRDICSLPNQEHEAFVFRVLTFRHFFVIKYFYI